MARKTSDRRTSLRTQASRRLLLVGLIASTILFVIGAFSFQFLNQRELALRDEQIRQYYADTLPRLEHARQQAAAQIVTRLEYSRILEGAGERRWPMLTAFLDAQWASNDFSNLLILDSAGRVLYGYGPEANTLRLRVAESGGWLYLPQPQQFFVVHRMPLWMGDHGHGQLLLFKTLSDAHLRNLAIPQTHLQLFYRKKFMASSDEAWQPDTGGASQRMRVEIPWSEARADGTDVPVLVVHRDQGDLYPFSQFAFRPLLAAIFIVGLLWLGLGRWLSRTTRRIAALEEGARCYAEGHDRTAFDCALAPALRHEDEIQQTARAFQYLVQTIEARDEEQRRYLDTLALLDEAVIEFDGTGRILRASPGWSTLVHDEVTPGSTLQSCLHADDAPLLQSRIADLLEGHTASATLRLRLRPRPGQAHETWVEARLMALGRTDAQETHLRGVLRDVTQTCLQEQQITHMALHDALTGLPNRVLLEDRFKVALRLASRNEDTVGVCFIDLDHFKTINDTLGHKAGDRLLVAFAERLRGSLRAGDTLARWGGDEFVLLLPDLAHESDVRQVADKVSAALQQPFELDGSDIRVTFSMGAAIFPHDGEDVETLFSHADRAMFHAKEQGRNQVCFFQDVATEVPDKRELYIQNRLAVAIEQGLIEAWFQPIIDARSGRCTAVEVLARWHDAELGWISPAIFIPMAENLGLIHALGQRILLDSLDALQRLQQGGLGVLMAVNISKRQLFVREFSGQIAAEVARRGLQPRQLVLEVTESVALHDVARGADHVQDLRRAGFLIAIDDFGTGYSSLSQLHEMSAVELKIDISFVRRLHEPAGRSMVQAIVNMASALGMNTVAEGVETQDTADILAAMGVTCLQGYLFARPMPFAQLKTWLLDNAAQYGAGEAAHSLAAETGS